MMNTRWCHPPSLCPLHIHHLVIDLVWFILQNQINSFIALEYDKCKSARISRITITHNLDRDHLARDTDATRPDRGPQ